MLRRLPILMAGADEELSSELSSALEREDLGVTRADSLTSVEKKLQGESRQVVILDLDTIPVNNSSIKKLRRQSPGICIIGLSSRSFHPELDEAMSSHIYACLSKPVDIEELIYWIKSIREG